MMKANLANPHRKDSSGFTLLEVMVALAILTVLSLLTSQTIRSAIQDRSRLTGDIDREARLADTLRIMRTDIATAFHYRDIDTQMYNEIVTNSSGSSPSPTPQGQQAPPNPPPQPAVNPQASPGGLTARPTPIDVTGFVGDAQSLYFTSLANVRTIKDAQESDQAKIGYFLKSCKSNNDTKAVESKCLMRTTSPYLDDDVTKVDPDTETVLVENVEDFKLRYLGPGHEDPVDTWKYGKDGDVNTKDNFPYAVEITLALHNKSDPKDKLVAATILAPIRFPNNPPSPSASASPGQAQGGGTSPTPAQSGPHK